MEEFNEGVDGKLASRMRKVNLEQFHTIVRMHLSFELDLNTEDSDCVTEKAKLKKWGLPSFSKKPKSTNLQKGMESSVLTLERICQVKQLIEYLIQEQNIVQEGIFRRTGKLTRQQDLKTDLYQGVRLNLDDGRFSVHDCASVLKGFLAELPEPLLTDLHYPAHCQIAELYSTDKGASSSRLLRSMQLLLLLLPSENRILLKHLLNLLNKTAACEHSNKMNCDTLATLFTPHLMCPRKLSPEALHINSQNLSGLVAFMIRKGIELFEIPPKLATDIRAYWVEQERKLLSPKKSDLNESTSDAMSTAHTVFSFVDHKLTAKANSMEDTQAALAQLYAHIQAMPESAKKRRLVKQFNKGNGQGTPRPVKHCKTKSLGDSIKRHIFQKKILGHKKCININIGCNITRSNSEENILSSSFEKSLRPSKTLFSKSDDELSMDSYDMSETENLLEIKHISNSTGSLNNTPSLGNYKTNKKVVLMSFVNIGEEETDEKLKVTNEEKSIERLEDRVTDTNFKIVKEAERKVSLEHQKIVPSICNYYDTAYSGKVRFSRYLSEPTNLHLSQAIVLHRTNDNDELVRQRSDPILSISRTNVQAAFSPKDTILNPKLIYSPCKLNGSVNNNASINSSPMTKNKFWNIRTAHTSTPSTLLKRNLATNEYALTPFTDNDKSMSPITQSATKMSKAMQESMMTPRSRKPVMMVSGSNLYDLGSVKNNNKSRYGSNLNLSGQKDCTSIIEESQKIDDTSFECIPVEESRTENKENVNNEHRMYQERNFVVSVEDEDNIIGSCTSITSTFREYLLSRSVLTASPVDLSFISRTDDYEPSESDLNIFNENKLSDSLLHCLNGNNPESDISGMASSSTNSANNSTGKIENVTQSPRKRGTSLQRNDFKRSIMERSGPNKLKNQILKNKQLSESTLDSTKVKETYQETSF